jgi:hypothetical protein
VLLASVAAAGQTSPLAPVVLASRSASTRISLRVPAVWGTIVFIVLDKDKERSIVLRNSPEELPRPSR